MQQPNAPTNDTYPGSATTANPANPEDGKTPPEVKVTIHRASAGIGNLAGDGQRDSTPNDTATLTNQHGIATRLLKDHGHDLRYIVEDKTWLVWTGRWQADPNRRLINRLVLTILDRLEGGTAQGASAKVKQERNARALSNLRTMSNLSGIADLASVLTSQSVERHELDDDPHVVGTPNGVLNLATGKLTAHDRSQYVLRSISTPYDQQAQCPRWTAFLHEVLGDDQELQEYMQRLVGYCLTGRTDHQKMWLLVGQGGNGKSTLVEVLRRLLGEYAQQVPDSVLMAGGRSSGPQNELVRLRGVRLGLLDESDQNGRVNESLAKRLVSSDCLVARPLYGDFQEFTPTAKFFLTTNYLPSIRGTDEGIWRRLVVLHFSRRFQVGQDPSLKADLLAELPGILTWAVEGATKYLRDGLTEPTQLQQATRAYRAEQDHVGQFLQDCTVKGEGHRVSAKDLADLWELWRINNAIPLMNDNARGKALRGHGLRRDRYGHDNRHHWFGISLNENSELVRELRAGAATRPFSRAPLAVALWDDEREGAA